MDKILILDFGSQYTQLIARRIRELNVFCEIFPFSEYPEPDASVKGIILSGSPFSVRQPDSPRVDIDKLAAHAPVLGVCYGAQLIALTKGGQVEASAVREYGRANLSMVDNSLILLQDVLVGSQVWMSHGDSVLRIPDGYHLIASSVDIPVAAFCSDNQQIFGVQFHPEVYHSEHGKQMLSRFVTEICGIEPLWTPDSFVESTISALRQQLGNDKVVLGLSGGVDSTVAALLLHRAIGKNLYCIFVDNGLLRKNEFQKVLEDYKKLDLNVKGVDATDEFLDALEGESEPEKKRKIIGKTFIDVFDREAAILKDVKWLAQGTIYPDVIESRSVKGPSATIKSHHNVGGLPDFMKLKIVEPLNSLFKDEVRKAGKVLGLDDSFVGRHPFPGPGLAIRVLGDITREKLEILKEADDIFINGLLTHGLYHKVWQAATIFLPVQSVGVMGDERTYENAICLRAVTSTDGMTADWVHLPYEFLAKISNEIINRVKGVNRVVYDISSKPPATIEWE
ncbi:MAG: glutamine-hydrolyzing GMP synthase [Bacteroidetes bacterium]|nr:glutamine-hydrolyzing GMP synthase [Bacteroidota bacterium]